MKRFVVVGAWVTAFILLGSGTAAAQQGGGGGGGSKVAYVNTQAILKATPGYASAESTFTREVETYRAEVQKLQASLDSAASDFEQAEGTHRAAAEAGAADPGAAAEGRHSGA